MKGKLRVAGAGDPGGHSGQAKSYTSAPRVANRRAECHSCIFSRAEKALRRATLLSAAKFRVR